MVFLCINLAYHSLQPTKPSERPSIPTPLPRTHRFSLRDYKLTPGYVRTYQMWLNVFRSCEKNLNRVGSDAAVNSSAAAAAGVVPVRPMRGGSGMRERQAILLMKQRETEFIELIPFT